MGGLTAADNAHMARALTLASRGRHTAHPNPMVGCLLVRDGLVIGEGWHRRHGEAHAEINALDAAGDARGATAYVTLEPCAHHGKTPPCADALIRAGIARAVIAMQDPYAEVRGRGVAALESAGIDVQVGLMQVAAETLNRGYLRRVRHGRPFVRLKTAASIDGAIAMRNGESQWITGPEARADVQRLRARSGAILTGIGTVLADDPSLTVRDDTIGTDGRQPLRAILDSRLRLPLSSRMLCLPGRIVIYCCDDTGAGPLAKAGAEVVRIAGDGGRPGLAAVLDDLGAREINDVLVEAGPGVAGSLLAAKLIDELVIYLAPHIMGSETVGMFLTPGWRELGNRCPIEIDDMRRVGADIRITARLAD